MENLSPFYLPVGTCILLTVVPEFPAWEQYKKYFHLRITRFLQKDKVGSEAIKTRCLMCLSPYMT